MMKEKCINDCIKLPVKKKYINEGAKLLKLVKSVPPSERGNLIRHLSDDLIHMLCECLTNLARNTFGFNSAKCGQIHKKLAPSKNKINQIISVKNSIKKKHRLLENSMTGKGIFTALSTIVLPAIISALSSL